MANATYTTPLKWFGIGIFLVAVVYLFVSHFSNTQEELKKAEDSYTFGEQAKTIADRKDGFNQALAIYLELNNRFNPSYGNGKLYFNIANTYFQLEEFPLAVYYYTKAKNLRPRDENVKRNLELTLRKIGLEYKEKSSFMRDFILLQTFLSLPYRLCILFSLTIVLFILCSTRIFVANKYLNSAIIVFGLSSILILASIFDSLFLQATQAIITKPVQLSRDAGEQYAKVMDQPVPAGSLVEVVDVVNGGLWLKITTEEGIFGFVPYSSAKLL